MIYGSSRSVSLDWKLEYRPPIAVGTRSFFIHEFSIFSQRWFAVTGSTRLELEIEE